MLTGCGVVDDTYRSIVIGANDRCTDLEEALSALGLVGRVAE